MKIWALIFGGLAIVAIALLFIALGMKVANRYNTIAWEKYYEGMGKRTPNASPVRRSANA